MKPGTKIVRIVTLAFFLSAIAYFGVYTFHVLFSGYETANLYTYSAEDTIEATGYMVREEQALQGKDTLQEIIPAEGETVAAGDDLATVYEDQKAFERHQKIQELESRLESLQYILSHSADASDSATLNSSIIDSVVTIHKLNASGELADLASEAERLKTLMFRRDYTYNGSSALTKESAQLRKKVEKLVKKNRSHTSIVTAPFSGTFSSMVDGYESVLTPDNIIDLTPAKLDELLAQQAPITEGTSLGKLVSGATWYFAAKLNEHDAQRLKIGDTVTMRFNSMTRTVDMNVDSLSRPDEQGTVCVVFSSNKYLAETTLLRDQTVDIIFDTVTGFRVDKAAVHVENSSGDIGVYRVYGAQAQWVSVEILWEEEDYYLIRQKPQYDEDGNLVESSQLDLARQLRNGTEVVVKGTELYDGKVVK